MNFGLALFDTRTPARGALCHSEGHQARHLSVREMTSQSVVWISNLDRSMVQRYFRGCQNIKGREFFGVDLYRLGNELDLDVSDGEGCPKKRALLSRTLARAGSLAERWYPSLESASSVKEAVKHTVFHGSSDEMSLGRVDVDEAMGEAYSAITACVSGGEFQGDLVQLRWPRVEYAQMMLRSFPVPVGDWQRVDRSGFPRNLESEGPSGEVYKFLTQLGSEVPALVSLRITDRQKDASIVLGAAQKVRGWMPIQEAAQVAAFCRVRLKDVIVNSLYEYPVTISGWALPSINAASRLSMSAGIVAENHWKAIADPRPWGPNIYGAAVIPARAVWMSAWDRLMCCKAALEFQNAGLNVYSYGQGAINIVASKSEAVKVIETCRSSGLTPPLSILNRVENGKALIAGTA